MAGPGIQAGLRRHRAALKSAKALYSLARTCGNLKMQVRATLRESKEARSIAALEIAERKFAERFGAREDRGDDFQIR